jgi:hypothetical protein
VWRRFSGMRGAGPSSAHGVMSRRGSRQDDDQNHNQSQEDEDAPHIPPGPPRDHDIGRVRVVSATPTEASSGEKDRSGGDLTASRAVRVTHRTFRARGRRALGQPRGWPTVTSRCHSGMTAAFGKPRRRRRPSTRSEHARAL